MLLDLDNFKSINDRFGHAVGDRVLELFAEVAGRSMRRMDLFGRLGGEEFAALLFDVSRDRALAIAEEIRSNFAAASSEVDGRPLVATVSIGIVVSHDATLDLAALLAQADHALYRAKDNGRNRVEVASIEIMLDRIRRAGGDSAVPALGVKAAAKSAA
jgi:diguanylate cyclase (GGDEF)-like protein